MEERRFWNGVAEEKKFTTEFALEEFLRLTTPESATLDIGCGYGRTLAELCAAGYSKLFGLDFSSTLLERCAREVPTASLTPGRAEALPYADESFDAALLLGVLTCVATDEAQRQILSEARRVLRVGGILCVSDFLINDDERNLARYARFAPKYGYGRFELDEGVVLRHHSPEYLTELFAEFTTVEGRQTTFRTMNGHESKGIIAILRK